MTDSNSSSMIRLNIGGKKFCTTVDTLTRREPDSMLAAMFSGRHNLCPDVEHFIDRDGKHFRHILNWLRDGTVVPTLQDSDYYELQKEAEYYQLLGLKEELHALLEKKKQENEDSCSDLTRHDIIKYYIRFDETLDGPRLRGVNLCGLDLSNLNLHGVDFSYACIRNVCFSGADLSDAKFEHANAEGAIFHHAIMPCCDFSNADLTDANFEEGILWDAKFYNAKFANTNFRKASLSGASLKGVDRKEGVRFY